MPISVPTEQQVSIAAAILLPTGFASLAGEATGLTPDSFGSANLTALTVADKQAVEDLARGVAANVSAVVAAELNVTSGSVSPTCFCRATDENRVDLLALGSH